MSTAQDEQLVTYLCSEQGSGEERTEMYGEIH